MSQKVEEINCSRKGVLLKKSRKRKYNFIKPHEVVRFKKCLTDKTSSLPDEILMKIFTQIPKLDLFLNVRFVCNRWNNLVKDKLIWRKSSISNDVSLIAPKLTQLTLNGRQDLITILKEISKRLIRLETLDLINCTKKNPFNGIYYKLLLEIFNKLHKSGSYLKKYTIVYALEHSYYSGKLTVKITSGDTNGQLSLSALNSVIRKSIPYLRNKKRLHYVKVTNSFISKLEV